MASPDIRPLQARQPLRARVAYISPESAAPEIAGTLDRLPRAHVFGLIAQAPGVFIPWLSLGTAMVNDLSIAPALRELVVLQVGRLAQPYEWDQHEPIARSTGITGEQITALEQGDVTGPFDVTQRAVLSFVADMVRGGKVSDGNYATLSELLSEQQIVEIAFVVAQYLGLARLMTALQIDPEPPIGAGDLNAVADALKAAT